MQSIPKSDTFIKGLSIQFLEASDGFKSLSENVKKEYIRQYEIIKKRFLKSLLGDAADNSEGTSSSRKIARRSPVKRVVRTVPQKKFSEKNIQEKKNYLLSKAVTGQDSSGMSETENLLFLEQIVTSELTQKDKVMEVFNILDEKAESTLPTETVNDTYLVSNTGAEGISPSAKVKEVVERDEEVFKNFKPSSQTQDENDNVFDFVTNITERTKKITPEVELLNATMSNKTPSDVDDDSTAITPTKKNLMVAFAKMSVKDLVTVAVTRYTTSDKVFFELYPLPSQYKTEGSIDTLKNNLGEWMFQVINGDDSMELIKDEPEEFTQLSMSTVVNFMQNRDVLGNKAV